MSLHLLDSSDLHGMLLWMRLMLCVCLKYLCIFDHLFNVHMVFFFCHFQPHLPPASLSPPTDPFLLPSKFTPPYSHVLLACGDFVFMCPTKCNYGCLHGCEGMGSYLLEHEHFNSGCLAFSFKCPEEFWFSLCILYKAEQGVY